MRAFLETERLTLRRFTEADEDNLLSWTAIRRSCDSSLAGSRLPAMR
jgi:hypothetical protein